MTNITTWLTTKERVQNVTMYFYMEPYGVFRRSAANPLFHPYFYDYAGDKQDFYSRMIAMNCDGEKE